MLLASPQASADAGLLVDATLVKPTGEKGMVTNSAGYGAEILVIPDRDAFTASIGGFFALGERRDGKVARDLYDFRVNFGFKPERTKGDAWVPFMTLGLDVLFITSHQPAGASFKGTTLGMNATAGFYGHLTETWIYRVNASYLGAIVPGTGDDLGGVVLQAGIGKQLGN